MHGPQWTLKNTNMSYELHRHSADHPFLVKWVYLQSLWIRTAGWHVPAVFAGESQHWGCNLERRMEYRKNVKVSAKKMEEILIFVVSKALFQKLTEMPLGIRIIFINKWILLFSKDAWNWSKDTVKRFTRLQKLYTSNKGHLKKKTLYIHP